MMKEETIHVLSPEMLQAFRQRLVENERSSETVSKYLRDITAFYSFLPPEKVVEKETVIAYKRHLAERYKGTSANSMLVAVNSLLSFLSWEECRVKLLRLQRQNFRKAELELTRDEYYRLLKTAKSHSNERLLLLMETICSTGIRVSEHKFITVESLREGVARVRNKGKERPVFLPDELIKHLKRYCKQRGITAGAVFVTRTGQPLDRSNIWADMKRLSRESGVDAQKIYPHNLRHLFALTYYSIERDIVHLADILGHSSVETTRIYTATSGREQKRILSQLRLVHGFA